MALEKSSKTFLRELKTVEAMVQLYCKAHHTTEKICNECEELLTYAENRLKGCIHGEKKPQCAKCLRHCYKPSMAEKMRKVMRYSGPKMIFHHPVLSFHHLLSRLHTGNQHSTTPRREK